MDEDEVDDYIPDTETEANQSVTSLLSPKDGEESKEESKKERNEETKKDANDKTKTKKREHDLSKIDAKGTKILRKLARYLLK